MNLDKHELFLLMELIDEKVNRSRNNTDKRVKYLELKEKVKQVWFETHGNN